MSPFRTAKTPRPLLQSRCDPVPAGVLGSWGEIGNSWHPDTQTFSPAESNSRSQWIALWYRNFFLWSTISLVKGVGLGKRPTSMCVCVCVCVCVCIEVSLRYSMTGFFCVTCLLLDVVSVNREWVRYVTTLRRLIINRGRL